MPDTASPIARYHAAVAARDAPQAQRWLRMAGAVPGLEPEAHLLHAVEAARTSAWAAAFRHGMVAAAAMPARPEPRWLLAAAARAQGCVEAAVRIALAAPLDLARVEVPPVDAPCPAAVSAPDAIVDVLVPVYAGLRQTRECLDSVIRAASANTCAHRVIVLDDASPDRELVAHLQALAATGQIELVRQPSNLGFIRNMNAGMALHPWRDVVWLNADTRVHDDWLDRLRAAALQDARTASATPLSNHGELMGFPSPGVRHPMPDAGQQAQLDERVRAAGAPGAVPVETGCGFCLYVRRAALVEIGLLDEGGLVRGYGEDTDWCARARLAGWRHVAATRVFVAHEGGVSFGAEKAARVRQNNAILRRRYPDAERRYDAALQQDPLRPVRQCIQRARLADLARWIAAQPRTAARCLVTPAAPAGWDDRPAPADPLVLRWRSVGTTTLAVLVAQLPPLPVEIDYRLPRDARQLRDDLAGLGLERLLFTHLRACPPALRDLPGQLRLPYGWRCEEDALRAPPGRRDVEAADVIELPWQALEDRYRRAFPGPAIRARANGPAVPPAAGAPSPVLLVADDLRQDGLRRRWVQLARDAARRGEGLVLLLPSAGPWEAEFARTGAATVLPTGLGLSAAETLALAGCRAAASLEHAPDAGWPAPGIAAEGGLPLFAPASAVAAEAGAVPLPAHLFPERTACT